MIPPLITGPIPPYNNPPIQPQYYLPKQFFISAITLGQNTTITTTINHDYVIGQLCRLIVPNGYGTRELNEQLGYVISIPMSNQVVLNIDSINFSSFINASLLKKAQILAVGDINSGNVNTNAPYSEKTFIPGSFINISPS